MTLAAQPLLGGEDLALRSGGPGGIGQTTPAYQAMQLYRSTGVTQNPMGGMPTIPPTLTPGPTPTPTPAPAPTPAPTSAPAPAPAVTPASATNAFGDFANSAGIQFATDQAMNALQNYYAAHGLLQSGPAMKGISDYIQNMALQNYLYPYMNYLSGQQAMGAQAGSAIAGVGSSYGNTVNGLGQNYSNAVTGINGGMANAIGQGALNIGNANANQAAINGMANAQLGTAIGGALGTLGSSFVPHPGY